MAALLMGTAACEPALDSTAMRSVEAVDGETRDATSGRADAAPGTSDAGQTTLACSAGETLSCACPSSSDDGDVRRGTQTCAAGVFASCVCPEPPGPLGGACKAGSYRGEFTGTYNTRLGLFEVPLKLSPVSSGEPGVAFTLEPEPGSTVRFTLTNGRVRANAGDAFELDGTLTGTLDCVALSFRGRLEATTSALAPQTFSAELTANYDVASASFVSGDWWGIEETTALDSNGQWNASSLTTP